MTEITINWYFLFGVIDFIYIVIWGVVSTKYIILHSEWGFLKALILGVLNLAVIIFMLIFSLYGLYYLSVVKLCAM